MLGANGESVFRGEGAKGFDHAPTCVCAGIGVGVRAVEQGGGFVPGCVVVRVLYCHRVHALDQGVQVACVAF